MACGGGDVKLLGSAASPFAVRARTALNIKGVSYEYVEEDLSNKSELLLASNPVHKKVPVLILGGKPVSESLVIVEYVDEAFAATGPALLPADPYERAIARFWAAFIDDKVRSALIGILMAATEEERAAKVEEMIAATGVLEGAFSQCSNGKAFFGGDSMGFVDLALGSYLFWLEALQRLFGLVFVGTGKTPLLDAWVERFGESSEGKKVLAGADAAVEYANMRLAEVRAATATE